MDESDPMSRVLDDLAGLRAVNDRLSARLARLERRRPRAEGPEAADETVTRRGLLRRLGTAAAAGVGLAAADSVFGAGPAAADHLPGFGHSNPVAVNTHTSGTFADDVFSSQNLGTGDALRGQAASGNGVMGWTNASRASGHAGVYGYNNADGDGVAGLGVGGNGVFGRSQATGASGVYGEGPSSGYGVAGRIRGATSSGGAGVFGEHEGSGNAIYGKSGTGDAVTGMSSASGTGVAGASDSGVGLLGTSGSGIALALYGSARILQTLRPGAAPTGGPFFAGEQIRDASGELWLCVAEGSPGTWRRAATVKEGFSGGSVNLLDNPIRVYDSRVTGGVLAGSTTRSVQVTGVVVGGVQVPAGAKGVVGNITVVATGASGYLSLFPQGSPPSPVTASINWFAASQVLNTAAVVRLNPANGQMGVGNGLAGGSTATHFVFDASGFIF